MGSPAIISSSKERSILRDGIKRRLYYAIGGLKSAITDGQLIRLDYNSFKIPLFQLQMAV